MDAATIGKQIKQYYPQYKDADDAVIGQKYLQKYGVAIQGVQSKQLDIKDIPEKQRVAVGFGLSAGGAEPPESDAIRTEKFKKKAKFEDVAQTVDILEKNLQQIRQRGPVAGGIAELTSKLTKGAANPEVGDYEALRKSLIGPLARAISGEVGVLTDRDIARAEQLLPKVSDAPKLIENKLKNLREIIGVKTGKKAESQQYPQESLLNAPTPQPQQSNQQQVQEPYQGTSALMALLEGRLNQIPRALSNYAGQRGQEFAQASQPGGNISPLINLGTGAGALPMKTAQTGKSVLSFLRNPGKFLGGKRNIAAEKTKDVVISGKDIAEAGAEYVKRQPLAEGVAKKILPALRKENFNPQTLVDRLSEWGKLTYTKGGDAKSTAGGQFFNALYASARKQLTEKAPEVSKLQNILSKGHTVSKTARKYAVPALVSYLLYRAGNNIGGR